VQAAIVETWCKAKASYYDDVRVRSVEWDRRGTYPNGAGVEFLRSSTSLLVVVQSMPGYGPDCGAFVGATPSVNNQLDRLYPASGRIDERIRIGQRVTVHLKSPHAQTYPLASVVTPIIGVDYDRRFALVANLTPIAGLLVPYAATAVIDTWVAAGPLDQLVQTAVHDYFDGLGPGSYTTVPLDPTYQDDLSTPIRPTSSIRIDRWPDEGRRWQGGLRKAALMAKIQAIPGVKSVTVQRLNQAEGVDFDPAPLQTLLPSAVYVAVQ
jgi:hypothetical protein